MSTRGKEPGDHRRSESAEAYPTEAEHNTNLDEHGAEAISFQMQVPKPTVRVHRRVLRTSVHNLH